MHFKHKVVFILIWGQLYYDYRRSYIQLYNQFAWIKSWIIIDHYNFIQWHKMIRYSKLLMYMYIQNNRNVMNPASVNSLLQETSNYLSTVIPLKWINLMQVWPMTYDFWIQNITGISFSAPPLDHSVTMVIFLLFESRITYWSRVIISVPRV
jgi:hypothetical protein